jgi:addiction module HigA family antidote
MEPAGLTVTATAERLGVDRKTLSRVINGKASLSTEMALRLAHAFQTSAEMWLNMQRNYDLWQTRQKLAADINNITPFQREEIRSC